MGKIEVRDFDGDFPALSAMAREAWLEEYGDSGWPDLYAPALARHLFSDLPDPRFLVAAYEGARLVAFVANLPRAYRINGRRYRGVCSNMLVARPGYRGAAVYVIGECIRRNHDFGADFALMALEKSHHSWSLFQTSLRPAQRLSVLKTMIPLVHAVDFERVVVSEALKGHEIAAIKLAGADRRITAPAVAGTIRPYRQDDLPQALALIQHLSDRDTLARVFDERSLAGQLEAEDATATVVYERAGVLRGFVNCTLRDMVSRRASERWAWLEFLSWEGCSAAEKRALLAGLWELSRQHGCIGLLEWNKGYYASWPLLAAHFIPYPRTLDVTAWMLNPNVTLPRVKGVFEQLF